MADLSQLRGYHFRNRRPAGAISLRRSQIDPDIQEQREALEFGKFELSAMNTMIEMKQQEEEIKHQLAVQRQVSAVTEASAQIDFQNDPDATLKFAKVMVDNPLAADNKFLNARFDNGVRVNRMVLGAKIADDSANRDDALMRGRSKHTSDLNIAEADRKMIRDAAMKGFEIKRNEETGDFDYGQIAADAQKAAYTVPGAETIQKYANANALIREHEVGSRSYGEQSRAAYLQSIEDAGDDEEARNRAIAARPAPYENTGIMEGARAEAAILEGQYPSLAGLKPKEEPAPPLPATLSNQPGESESAPVEFKVGGRYGDMRFKGGDPNSEESWEHVQ